MPIIPWECAQGDAPPVTLPVAATVEIAPPDDSVDTNKVIIQGAGTISSFGSDAPLVTKDVKFVPTGGSITLVNSASFTLIGNVTRTVIGNSYSRFASDGAGNWLEIGSSAAGGGYLGTVAAVSGVLQDIPPNGILATYAALCRTIQLIFRHLQPSTNNNAWLIVHANGSFQTANNSYATHTFSGTNTSNPNNGILLDNSQINTGGAGLSGEVKASFLSGTMYPKQWFGMSSTYTGGSNPGSESTSVITGYWTGLNAIDGFQIQCGNLGSGNTWTAGSIDIYGLQ
jgi:hypothetical protein